MHIRRTVTSVLLLALCSTWGVSGEAESETSESLYRATYGEAVGRVGAAVGSDVARVVKGEKFLPLEIAVGVKGDGPELHFEYNSFALMDSAQNVYRVAQPKDVLTERKFWAAAKRFQDQRPIPTGALAQPSEPVGSNFYNKDGTLFGGVWLSNGTHFQDTFFFPMPEAGLGGVLQLRIETEGMEAPIIIRFKIPVK